MVFVALFDWVAVLKMAIMGNWVGVVRAAVRSPMLKRIAMEKAKAKAPLRIMLATMLRGTTMPALSTSSPKRLLTRMAESEWSKIATDSCGMHNRFLWTLVIIYTNYRGLYIPVIE